MAVVAQLAVSLFAILALAWLAQRLGLGRDVRIRDEEHARLLADEVLFGFDAQDTVVDKNGQAALLRNQAGTIVLVKLHGAQFSGRMLGHESTATLSQDSAAKYLQVDSGERPFGKASLKIDAPEDWAKAINGLGTSAGHSAGKPAHA